MDEIELWIEKGAVYWADISAGGLLINVFAEEKKILLNLISLLTSSKKLSERQEGKKIEKGSR